MIVVEKLYFAKRESEDRLAGKENLFFNDARLNRVARRIYNRRKVYKPPLPETSSSKLCQERSANGRGLNRQMQNQAGLRPHNIRAPSPEYRNGRFPAPVRSEKKLVRTEMAFEIDQAPIIIYVKTL